MFCYLYSVWVLFVYFSATFGTEETQYFIRYTDACLWETLVLAGSYFGLSKQCCRRASFYIPSWSFLWKRLRFGLLHVKELWKNCPTSAFICLHPPLHFTHWEVSHYILYIHTLPHNVQCYIVALLSTRAEAERGTLLPAWHRRINKRLWSTTEKLKYSETLTFQAVLWPGKAKKGLLLPLTFNNSSN